MSAEGGGWVRSEEGGWVSSKWLYGSNASFGMKIRLEIAELFFLYTQQDVAESLVPILATRELVAPHAGDPIM